MELAFTPGGRIVPVAARAPQDDGAGLEPQAGAGPPPADPRVARLARALAAHQGHGLFLLATERCEGLLTPSLIFWRDFAGRYLTELCHVPEGADLQSQPLAPPDAAEMSHLLANVPPMPGSEYLRKKPAGSVARAGRLGPAGQVAAAAGGLPGFLKRRAPLWHQVGRVCFHLAENRRIRNYPFAFLATYAAGLQCFGPNASTNR